MSQLHTQKNDGYGNISSMKRWNRLGGAAWFFVLSVVFAMIRQMVNAQYERQSQPLDRGSTDEFLVSITLGFVYIIILTGLWWLGTTCSAPAFGKLRNSFEQYTFAFSLAFTAAAVIGTLLIYIFCGNGGIYGEDGETLYPLTCIFILPAFFAALMYTLPPLNVRDVILPAKRSLCLAIRLLIGAVIAAMGIVLFVYNFRT